MNQGRFRVLALAGVLAFACGTVHGEDEEVGLEAVPVAARRAAGRAVPDAKWAKAWKVAEPGPASYELSGSDASGDDVGVTVTAAGEVTEVEHEIELTRVPKVVRAALRAKLPKFKPQEALSVRRAGQIVGYTFEGKQGAEELDIFVSADGKTVEEED